MRTSLKAMGSIYLPSSASTTGQVPLEAIAKLTVAPLAVADLASQAVPGDDDLVQPRARRLARRGGRRDQRGDRRDRRCRRASRSASRARRRRSRRRCRTNCSCSRAAVLTMYIVLGVLYESFIHPITILSTLPSAGIGALLALNCGRRRARHHRRHRHRAADRHRQEERDHDDRLRARGAARARACRRARRSIRPVCCGCGRS